MQRPLRDDFDAHELLRGRRAGVSTASTASSAAIATASCVWSGSRVVSRWSWMPGHIRIRAHRLRRFLPNHLMSSNDRPATSGTARIRVGRGCHHSGVPIGAKTKIATIITMSRKLVPQRGWKREKRWAFSGVSGEPRLVAGDRLVLGAVVLEDPAQVRQPRDEPQVADEDRRRMTLLDDQNTIAVAEPRPRRRERDRDDEEQADGEARARRRRWRSTASR